MSRLTGPEIKKQFAAGNIEIEPYDPKRVQAASIDLTLGTQVRVLRGYGPMSKWYPTGAMALDVNERTETKELFDLRDKGEIRLVPGILYLMHTVERIHTLHYEVEITGKSSLGRLGILVHFTAGHVDPGFNGQYTLEVAVVHPVRIYAGWPVCQARFHTLQGEVEDYRKKGNYVGQTAMGAQQSASWRHNK